MDWMYLTLALLAGFASLEQAGQTTVNPSVNSMLMTVISPSPSQLQADAGGETAGPPLDSGSAVPTAPDSWYLRGEYLLWWLRNARLPPLLTTGPPGSDGVLGRPGTIVLFGDQKLETERHSVPGRHVGVRLRAGFWFDPEQTLGLQGSFFFLERDSSNYVIRSKGDLLLARPFINILDGSETIELVAGTAPDGSQRSGEFNGFSKIELFGQEANVVRLLAGAEHYRLELLTGVHFLQMRERLDLTASSKLLPDEAVIFGVSDHFRLFNRFYGGQVGLNGEYTCGRLFLQLRGALSLGATREVVRTFGERLFATPTLREVQPHGLLVLPSNRGKFTEDRFDVVSEGSVNFGCQLTSHLRAFAGYTLIYWTNPVRPGDQIERAVNPSQIPAGQLIGPPRPAIPFRDDYFWAQGLHLGLEWRW